MNLEEIVKAMQDGTYHVDRDSAEVLIVLLEDLEKLWVDKHEFRMTTPEGVHYIGWRTTSRPFRMVADGYGPTRIAAVLEAWALAVKR